MRMGRIAAAVVASLVVPAVAGAATILSENFDGNSVASTFNYTNSGRARRWYDVPGRYAPERRTAFQPVVFL